MYEKSIQIGFARVVSDYSVTSYLFDVFILPTHQGSGLGKWLIECVLDHPKLKNVTMALATKDKQEFYRNLGFKKT